MEIEEIKRTEEQDEKPLEEVTWQEADIHSSQWVRLETDVEKKLTIHKWKLARKEDRFTGEPRVFFMSEVTNEDGTAVNKLFENASTRLRLKLKGVLKDLDPSKETTITVLRTGEKLNTNYLVKLVGE
jgi:hypothetical protein